MRTTFKNRNDRIAHDVRMIEGITKHFPKKTSFKVAGKTTTSDELVALLQTRIAATHAADAARAAWLHAVTQMQETLAETDPVLAGFTLHLLATLGTESNDLSDFGIAARKRGTSSVESKFAAVEKRRAKRAARQGSGEQPANGGTTPPAPPAIPTPTPGGT